MPRLSAETGNARDSVSPKPSFERGLYLLYSESTLTEQHQAGLHALRSQGTLPQCH